MLIFLSPARGPSRNAKFPGQRDTNGVNTRAAFLASSLASQLDDTRLAVGGETMQEASQVYTYFKAAARTTPGLKPIADQLAERFQKAGKPKPGSTPKA